MKNNKKIKDNKKIAIILVVTFSVILAIFLVSNIKNKEKIKVKAGVMDEAKMSLVDSADGKKVPVPKGYTASSVEDEKYVNNVFSTEKYYKQEDIEFEPSVTYYFNKDLTSTLKSQDDVRYPWEYNEEYGVYQSGNYNKHNSTSSINTDEFTLDKKGLVRIEWSVSSEGNNYDYLYYTITNKKTNKTIGGISKNIGGTNLGRDMNNLRYEFIVVGLDEGTYNLSFTYRKDGIGSVGLDRGFIKSVKLYSQEETSEESLTYSTVLDYPWNYDEEGKYWYSGNYNNGNSTSTIETKPFTLEESGVIGLEWSISSEVKDYLSCVITNTQTNEVQNVLPARINGTYYGSSTDSLKYVTKDFKLEPGTYKVTISYVKNATTNSGLDRGYIKSLGLYTKNTSGDSIDVENLVHSGGFVIYEGDEPVTEDNVKEARKTRNQWVWVPVSDVEDLYHISDGKLYGNRFSFTENGYTISKTNSTEPSILVISDKENSTLLNDLNGMTQYDLNIELQQEFSRMIQSVATYGGFYIGRYETGNLSQDVPAIIKLNRDISKQNWYKIYEKSKRLAANSSVETSMIWSCQWDETMKWILESKAVINSTGEVITNIDVGKKSTTFGNYKDAEFEYYSSDTSNVTSKKYAESYYKIPTGGAEYTELNNIYDMAGNVYEWTLDSYNSLGRIFRGGYNELYSYNRPISNRDYIYPSNSYDYSGSRAVLYIL